MNIYCECGEELEVMGDEGGRIDVAPHLCAADELAAYKEFVEAYDRWANDIGYFGEPFDKMVQARAALKGGDHA